MEDDKPKLKPVKVGAVSLPVYYYGDNRYATIFRRTKGGKRETVTRRTEEDLREAARVLCIEIANGQLSADRLSGDERLQAVAARKLLAPLGLSLDAAARELVNASEMTGGAGITEMARFWARHHQSDLSTKTASEVHALMLEDYSGHDLNPRYRNALVHDLGRFVRTFPLFPVGDITGTDIREYLRKQPGNWRTYNGRLSVIVTFFNWAKTNKFLPSDRDTEADAVKRMKRPRGESNRPGVLSAEQLGAILEHVGTAWLPFVALGTFAGLRRAEIERLRWSDVRWEERIIHIREDVAKNTGRAAGDERFVPIREQLLTWLAGWRGSCDGPVCTRTRWEDELARLRAPQKDERGNIVRDAVITYPWPKNAFRHTYGSCRCGEAKNMALVAEEMGNSVPILKKDYRNPRTDREVAAWAALYPGGAKISNVVSMRVAGS